MSYVLTLLMLKYNCKLFNIRRIVFTWPAVSDTQDRGGIKTILMYLFGLCLLILKNVMTSEVLHSSVEATYITVETASFYGVKQKPSRVLVNSQDAVFTYSTNKVSSGVDGQAQKTGNYCHA